MNNEMIYEGMSVMHPIQIGIVGEVIRTFTVSGGDKVLAEIEFPQGRQTWAVASLKRVRS